MSNIFVHPSSVVDDGATLGEGTKIWHYCHVSVNAIIGRNCNLGQNVFVGNDVSIGKNCKIQNNVSIYNSVTIEDDVFCGPSMVFTNVYNPRATVEKKDEFRKTLVKKGSTIGANATIVCGVTLGEYCFIGAGAVITKDVEPYSLMVGVPARKIGEVDKKGNIIK